MKAPEIVALVIMLAAVVVCVPAPAQTSPVCFAFNDTGTPSGPALSATCPGSTWIHFTAPGTLMIDAVEVYAASNVLPAAVSFAVDLYQTAGLGVQPSVPAGATLSGFIPFSPGWQILTTQGMPFVLVGGATYAFFTHAQPFVGQTTPCASVCVSLGVDPAGATPLPCLNTGPTCAGVLPAGPVGLMIRFRGPSCGPGTPAGIGNYFGACGHSTLNGIAWLSAQKPVLGASWSLQAYRSGGGAAHLFWSSGLNFAGAAIAAGSSCLHYLDEASLATLAAAGAEPLVSGTIPPIYPGMVSWTFTIPSSPAYAGLILGAQALVVSSTGTIPIGGGLFAQTSNALLLALGY